MIVIDLASYNLVNFKSIHMKYLTGIYLTDEESQGGKQYNVKELERLIWMSKSGTPSSMNHDVHRVVGWTVVNGLYLSHEKSYVLGKTGFPETDEELEKIRLNTKAQYYKRIENAKFQYGEEFMGLLRKKGLERKEVTVSYNNMLMVGYDCIVADLFPKLVAKRDSDGLFFVEDILHFFVYKGQGVFCEKFGEMAITLHPYLRLSQSLFNDFDYRFVSLLMNVYKAGNKSVKVRIDLDRIGYAPSFLYSYNDDYWFIPYYDDSMEFIRTGLQTYQMPESYAVFNQLDRTEYKWQNKKDGIVQLEMEEVITEKAPMLQRETYACRYLHTMIDTKTGLLSHFDGAIRAYDAEKIYDRIGITMDNAGYDTEYTKLFRMDNKIPMKVWKELITQFLQGNPSIYGVLGESAPNIVMTVDEKPDNPLQTYVPYIINKGDGVRLYVSYHNRQDCDVERKFETVDNVETGDGIVDCMEFQAIEIAKAIWKEGGKLDLIDGMKYLIVEDYNHNIPIIMHGDKNLPHNMLVTLNGIKRLMKCHVDRGDNDVYSICLSWNMDESKVCLSIIGHVEDINKWLKKNNIIPTDHHNFTQWLERQSKLLKRYGKDSYAPVGNNLIKNDGVLYLQRRSIEKDVSLQGLKLGAEGLIGRLVFKDDKKELEELYKDKKVFPTMEAIASSAKCEETGDDYMKTEKSAILDNVSYIPDFKLLGFMWTTNPRPIRIV